MWKGSTFPPHIRNSLQPISAPRCLAVSMCTINIGGINECFLSRGPYNHRRTCEAAAIIFRIPTYCTRSTFTYFLGLSLISPAFYELGVIVSVKSETLRNLPRIMPIRSKRAKTESPLFFVTLYCSPLSDHPGPVRNPGSALAYKSPVSAP